MKKMDFRHREGKDYISRYIVYREKDIVYVQNKFFPETVLQPKLYTFHIHAGNIPAALEAIAFVFKAPMGWGEVKDFVANGESVSALMSTERQITDLRLKTERDSQNSGMLRFYFDQGEIPSDPNKRVYTPAMVWVMNAMQEEYDAWKKEQDT